MSATISSIHYCPVKSVSFQSVSSCEIKKNIGIVGDRIFAFVKELNLEEAKKFEKDPEDRRGKWNKILTLKNSPVMNKYNFLLNGNELTLSYQKEKIFEQGPPEKLFGDPQNERTKQFLHAVLDAN